jgi:hypothetical protein
MTRELLYSATAQVICLLQNLKFAHQNHTRTKNIKIIHCTYQWDDYT